MDLIDKALRLYDEIESRQRELRDILTQLQAMQDEQCTMHDEQCTMHDEQCTMHDAQCTMHDQQEADDKADVDLASITTLNTDTPTAAIEEISDTDAEPTAEESQTPVEEAPSCTAHRASSINERRPDLWKSLTINDRFRFRRELFAGDDAAMSEAINRLSQMDSLSEADAYLSTMPWESDSEAVGEFMTILSNHFNRF